ncbi:MAG TPA: OmpH family outer membrane protein [Chitinophagales bacterium]|nr:OmpH family outer membrane protein [Chitinophagales bacterium]HMX04345.1 OmpH family outer membrane protein [Chitinophagales bacterium]HMZ88073.1 OmpH family outer membrane protein [Chitinophagales bacterium]HNA57769.1 OmpH family outer membrane protein [Chitinophagales bacterium]HNF68939.1 OmpH family outer membrane protein [Chitinophagales bacterium]
MKQIKWMLVVAVMAYSSIASAQQVKIAYINSQELLSSMPEAKAANDKLVAYAREFDSLYQDYVQEYQMLVNDIQGNPNLSEVAREAKIQDAVMLEDRITSYEKETQQKLDAKKQELFEPIIKNTTEIIKTVAKENGYTHVIDNSLSVVIMAPEGDDILPLVKKKMNIQ